MAARPSEGALERDRLAIDQRQVGKDLVAQIDQREDHDDDPDHGEDQLHAFHRAAQDRIHGAVVMHFGFYFSAVGLVGIPGHHHARMSFHAEDSDLALLRKAPPGMTVEVASETVEVLRIALDLYRESNGLFDVTIGRELVRSGFLPRPEGPMWSRHSGTSADIEILDDRRVRCHKAILIDLGGIAKGFAVDRAVAALQSAGAMEGLVNAGGDLRMYGDREWVVQLRDGDGAVRTSIALADCAIASSSNFGNRRRRLGRLYTPHIGSGRSPVAISGRVSVIADRCVMADAITKVAIACPETAQEMIKRYGGYILPQSDLGKAA